MAAAATRLEQTKRASSIPLSPSLRYPAENDLLKVSGSVYNPQLASPNFNKSNNSSPFQNVCVIYAPLWIAGCLRALQYLLDLLKEQQIVR